METPRTSAETGVVDGQPGNNQLASFDAPTLPTQPGPTSAPPDLTRSAPVGLSWLPTGSALWMAFLYGVAGEVMWTLIGELFALLTITLQSRFNFGLPLYVTNLENVAFVFLVMIPPLSVLLVASGRALRGASAAQRGQAVGALLIALLMSLAFGAIPPYLLYLLAFQFHQPSLAQPFLSLLDPRLSIADLNQPTELVFELRQPAFLLALPAVCVWGRRTRTGMAIRWLAPLRWLLVGLSAIVGYIVFELLVVLITDVFITFPLTEFGTNSPQPLQIFWGQLTSITPLVVIGCVAALVGGALSLLIRRRGRPEAATGAPPADTQPQRGRLVWLVGALGLLIALGAIGVGYLALTVTSLSFVAQILLPLLLPLLIMLVTLFFAFRLLGVGRSLASVGLMVCSLAPLPLVFITLTPTPGSSDQIALFDPALATSLFGVALGLGVVFGRNGVRWRWRSAGVGALLGGGFLLPTVALAMLLHFTPPGACYGGEGCGLGILFAQFGIPALLFEQASEAVALALVGATLGGWLRAGRRG